MTLLADQRTMCGAAPHETPEQVAAFWELFAARQQEAGRPFELKRSRKRLVAYVSDGRWVAECPVCAGGIALWRENPEACCLDCGSVYSKIDWPSEQLSAQVERVLAARTIDSSRNWRPDRESLEDLKIQNLKAGDRPVAG